MPEPRGPPSRCSIWVCGSRSSRPACFRRISALAVSSCRNSTSGSSWRTRATTASASARPTSRLMVSTRSAGPPASGCRLGISRDRTIRRGAPEARTAGAAGPRRPASRSPSAASGAAAATCGVKDTSGTVTVSVLRTRSAPATRATAQAAKPPATTQEMPATFDPTPATMTPYSSPPGHDPAAGPPPARRPECAEVRSTPRAGMAALLSGVGMVSPGVFADLAAQRACWHPVAFGTDVADRPVHADLLGEPLVVWRGAGGAARVRSDLCMHRGTALSLGWVAGDELVCAYHAWRYGADGRCTAIPQKEDPAAVPAKARVRAFLVQERYGLIWVALEQPRWPLPEVPELETDGWAVVAAGPYRGEGAAARQGE